MNREVRCAVIESRPDVILDQGMPYDRCQVGVVTDLDGWPELARHDIHAREGMTRVVRTQMDVVLSSGAAVLNADVGDVAALADFCDGEIIWTSLQAPAVDEPAAQRSVRCVHGQVQLCVGAQIQATAPLPELAVLVAPEVVCAAAAAAWAVGMSPALIAAGLDNFAALPGA
jgi:cyanophycin synthetase